MNSQNEIPLLILSHARNLGRIKILQLIEQFGSPEEVIQQGWNIKTRCLFNQWDVGNWEEDLEAAEKKGVYLVSYLNKNYPLTLLKSKRFPLLLYIKGTLLPSDIQSVAVVGTRNATLYGKQIAEKVSMEIASAGMSVVSGLARGIDTAAHEGALKAKGRTLAIIGSGLNHIYPAENSLLSEKISHSGAVISEFPMSTPPHKTLFPQRNKTLCGITMGVCLIESPLRGGGMITMKFAEENNTPLFCLPGRVDWPTFEGNHFLLKQKKAELIETGNDILKFFKISPVQQKSALSQSILSLDEKAFLAHLPVEEKSIEELVLLTQLPIMQLNILLTRLVLKKVVKEFPGKIYKKIYF